MPLGPPEIIVILIIALLVLGPKRLPEAGRGLGRGMREFKDGLTGNKPAAVAERSPEPSDAAARGGS